MTPSALAGKPEWWAKMKSAHHAYDTIGTCANDAWCRILKSAHQASTLSFPACANGVMCHMRVHHPNMRSFCFYMRWGWHHACDTIGACRKTWKWWAMSKNESCSHSANHIHTHIGSLHHGALLQTSIATDCRVNIAFKTEDAYLLWVLNELRMRN